MSIAKRITKARIDAGLKKGQLAKLAGVTPSSVTQWETGQTKSIEGGNLVKIAAACGVSAAWLATGQNPPVHVGNAISATPHRQLGDNVVSDPAVSSLVTMFLRMSKANQHRTLLECQLRVLDDSPQSADDPFEAIGLTNLLTREGSDDGSQGIAVSPEAERRSYQNIGGTTKSRKK